MFICIIRPYSVLRVQLSTGFDSFLERSYCKLRLSQDELSQLTVPILKSVINDSQFASSKYLSTIYESILKTKYHFFITVSLNPLNGSE